MADDFNEVQRSIGRLEGKLSATEAAANRCLVGLEKAMVVMESANSATVVRTEEAERRLSNIERRLIDLEKGRTEDRIGYAKSQTTTGVTIAWIKTWGGLVVGVIALLGVILKPIIEKALA